MTSNPARGWEYENNALKILENPSERSTNFKIFWGSIPFRMLPRNLPNTTPRNIPNAIPEPSEYHPSDPSECYPGTFRMLLGTFRMLARRCNHWALRIRVPSIFYIYIFFDLHPNKESNIQSCYVLNSNLQTLTYHVTLQCYILYNA